MPVVRVLQLVDDEPQGKDLLVDFRIGGGRVHGHLGVHVLPDQPVGGDSAVVAAALPPVPAVGGHLVLAGPDVRVLTHDVRQLGPEPLRVFNRSEDVVHEVVDVTAGGLHGMIVPGDGMVVPGRGAGIVPKPAVGLPPPASRVATILKHL